MLKRYLLKKKTEQPAAAAEVITVSDSEEKHPSPKKPASSSSKAAASSSSKTAASSSLFQTQPTAVEREAKTRYDERVSNGWVQIDNGGYGDCMFRSVACALTGEACGQLIVENETAMDLVQILRLSTCLIEELALNYLSKKLVDGRIDQTTYNAFLLNFEKLPNETYGKPATTLAQALNYTKQLEQKAAWGGASEFTPLSYLINAPIFVTYIKNQIIKYVDTYDYSIHDKNAKTIGLVNDGGKHFVTFKQNANDKIDYRTDSLQDVYNKIGKKYHILLEINSEANVEEKTALLVFFDKWIDVSKATFEIGECGAGCAASDGNPWLGNLNNRICTSCRGRTIVPRGFGAGHEHPMPINDILTYEKAMSDEWIEIDTGRDYNCLFEAVICALTETCNSKDADVAVNLLRSGTALLESYALNFAKTSTTLDTTKKVVFASLFTAGIIEEFEYIAQLRRDQPGSNLEIAPLSFLLNATIQVFDNDRTVIYDYDTKTAEFNRNIYLINNAGRYVALVTNRESSYYEIPLDLAVFTKELIRQLRIFDRIEDVDNASEKIKLDTFVTKWILNVTAE